MENLEIQKEELISIQSIYHNNEVNLIFEEGNPPCGHFSANVCLPSPFHVTYRLENTAKSDSANETSAINTQDIEKFEVKNLPPINLFFELPATYPSNTCPAFLLSCQWLSPHQLSKICRYLESMWYNDAQILFMWCQFLEYDVIGFLDLTNGLDLTDLLKYKFSYGFYKFVPEIKTRNEPLKDSNDSKLPASKEVMRVIRPAISGGSGQIDARALNDLADGKSLINIIKNYNEYKSLEIFNRKFHVCDICFASKAGSEFTIFRQCNHAFCTECLKEFFEVHIREGNVNCLSCPSDKCTSQADGTMVQQIVDKKLFERYDEILLSRTLETMADITYCPRKWCQCAVLMDTSERMGSCPSCQFVFCPYCKMGYHGVAPCAFKSEEKQAIFEQYINGDNEVKERLEKRHGKRAIKALVEDSLSESWKNTNSKCCPHCKASIEKSDGCNKMTCFRCGIFFCWECMKQLDLTNPYRHFNDRYGDCVLFPDDELDNNFEIEPGEFLQFL